MREDSKKNWTSGSAIGEINAGSLQRIADATEAMAKNYQTLLHDAETYKKWWREEQKRRQEMESTLRGVRANAAKLLKRARLAEAKLEGR